MRFIVPAMGFMDKIKGAVKAVTGGAAKVTVEYPKDPLMPGDSVAVRVTVTSTGGEVKSKGVFIDLRGNERVRINKRESQQLEENLDMSRDTFNEEIQISGEFVLGANETQTIDGQITVPPNVQPSYAGNLAEHRWEIRGRLEARGNDPDSGYLPLRVGLRG